MSQLLPHTLLLLCLGTRCSLKVYIIMSYYGLSSRDIHTLDHWWRIPLCTLLFVEITILRTGDISIHKNNSHDLHRVNTHSLVLVLFSLGTKLEIV